VDKALDERTIGHNPERLCLLKGAPSPLPQSEPQPRSGAQGLRGAWGC
jgi:hypothetical protein